MNENVLENVNQFNPIIGYTKTQHSISTINTFLMEIDIDPPEKKT